MTKTSELKLDHPSALRLASTLMEAVDLLCEDIIRSKKGMAKRELKVKRQPGVQLPKRKIKLRKFSDFFREIQSRRNDTAAERLSRSSADKKMAPWRVLHDDLQA
jgi:hypothetical protein